MWKYCVFRKADMDTVLAGFIGGVSGDVPLKIASRAEDIELLDPKIICLEAGGSGLWWLNNFDHHGLQKALPSACLQAWGVFSNKWEPSLRPFIERMVTYVDLIDTGQAFKQDFPSFSHLYSGMLLGEKNPVDQFRKGYKLFEIFITEKMNPFEPIPSLFFEKYPYCVTYLDFKIENHKKLLMDLEKVEVYFCKSGKVLYLETEAMGALGALYERGAKIAICYHPGLKKFTIASKDLDLSELLKTFQSIEPGWGGRKHIFGSPFEGSRLSKEQVLKIILNQS